MKEIDLRIRLGSGYYSKQPYVGKNERTSKDTDLSAWPFAFSNDQISGDMTEMMLIKWDIFHQIFEVPFECFK